MGTRYKTRRGSRFQDVPVSEHLGVGQMIWDPDEGSLGVGAGEQNPRWLPGVDINNNLVIYEGKKIVSNENPNTYISFESDAFSVVVDGQERLNVGAVSGLNFDDVSFEHFVVSKIETQDFEQDVGFKYDGNKLVITCPVDFLGPINLSLQEFANAILPTGYTTGDLLVAGNLGSESHSWKNPSTLLKTVNEIAPLLYRATGDNTRTVDLKFGKNASFFGVNANNRGCIDNDLVTFLQKFGSSYARGSVAGYFNRKGQYALADFNTPRFEYDPYTGRFLGLKIEGGASNLDINALSMSGWSNNNAVATQVMRSNWTDLGFTSPFNIAEQASGEHYHQKAFTNLYVNKAYAVSRFIELPASDSTMKFKMQVFDGINTVGLSFIISATSQTTNTELAGAGTLIKPFIQRITPTIFRVGFGFILNSSDNTAKTIYSRLQILDTGGTTNYTGSRSTVFYTNNHQLELGDRPTSFIPTTGSVGVRQPDNMFLDLSGGNFSYEPYKNFINVKFLSLSYYDGDPIFTLFDGNYIAALQGGANQSLVLSKGNSGSLVSTIVGSNLTDLVTYNFECTGLPSTVTNFNLGSNADHTKYLNGWINNLTLTNS